MLRSKIQKILEQNFLYKCPSQKLSEYENKLRKWKQREKEIKNEEYLAAITKETPDQRLIDFKYSKRVPSSYIPNIKEI